jgi:hypothetical protein
MNHSVFPPHFPPPWSPPPPPFICHSFMCPHAVPVAQSDVRSLSYVLTFIVPKSTTLALGMNLVPLTSSFKSSINFHERSRWYKKQQTNKIASNEDHFIYLCSWELQKSVRLLAPVYICVFCLNVHFLRRMRWAEYVACMKEMRNTYEIMVGKVKGVRPFGWPRRRW